MCSMVSSMMHSETSNTSQGQDEDANPTLIADTGDSAATGDKEPAG